MQLDANTILGITAFASSAIAAAVGWVISVEKRINGLRELRRMLDKMDSRTERMSLALLGRDVADDHPMREWHR